MTPEMRTRMTLLCSHVAFAGKQEEHDNAIKALLEFVLTLPLAEFPEMTFPALTTVTATVHDMREAHKSCAPQNVFTCADPPAKFQCSNCGKPTSNQVVANIATGLQEQEVHFHLCDDCALKMETEGIAIPGPADAQSCLACNGTGKYRGLMLIEDCRECSGTGRLGLTVK